MADSMLEEDTVVDEKKNDDYNEKSDSRLSRHDSNVTKDGIRLHPQPTTDPLDPLNWTNIQKNSLLGIVMYLYFMFTFITTATVPSFPDLQVQFGLNYSEVNWTVAVPALGLAVGPLLWSSFSDIYGRRLIFIIGTLMAFGATIGAAKTSSYGGYMAARFFQGLGVSPGATVGLAIINDIFFEHQRGQKTGLWVLAIDTGLFVGPFIGGFMNLVSAAWIQWLTAILFAVLLGLELAFLPETLYPRNHMLSQVPMATTTNGQSVDIEKVGRRRSIAEELPLPRTKSLFFINIKPIPGMRHPKPWDSLLRFGMMFAFPAVSIAVISFCYMWYWFVLSVITMIPSAYVQDAPDIQGCLFVGLLLGTLFAEFLLGGRLSDYISLRLSKRNNNIRLPEMRLWLIYPAGLLSAVGLVLFGISIDKGYHWIVGEIALFLFAAGIQMGNTSLCAYIVDAYPLQSMSVVTFYSVCLNLSAFINPFFIAPWQASVGWSWCFATQGLIIVFGALPVLGLLHRYGAWLRLKAGQPGWVNPEFDTFAGRM